MDTFTNLMFVLGAGAVVCLIAGMGIALARCKQQCQWTR